MTLPFSSNSLGIERRAGYKPAPTLMIIPKSVANTPESLPGNRAIKPSFRRKPESRTLGSRRALFLEDFLDSGFRRNDGCLSWHS